MGSSGRFSHTVSTNQWRPHIESWWRGFAPGLRAQEMDRTGCQRSKEGSKRDGAPNLRADGVGHGAEVDGQVGGVGDKAAVRAEQGAGEVQALLDVHADAGALQRAPHLLRQAHEPGGRKAGLQNRLALLRTDRPRKNNCSELLTVNSEEGIVPARWSAPAGCSSNAACHAARTICHVNNHVASIGKGHGKSTGGRRWRAGWGPSAWR